MASPIAIRATGVCKALAGRPVLRQLDFSLLEGEIAAIMGANGAGKTTLLRCLAGMIRPDAGEIIWFGRPAGSDLGARRLIGMASHQAALYPHLTIRENLVFAARMCGMVRPGRRAEEWLHCAGLDLHADRLPARLSRGMRQRIAILRAMIHEPRVLLLDEPFSGLDHQGAEWLLGLLRDRAERGQTICFVTHEEDKAVRLAGTVLELCSGRLHAIPARGLAAGPDRPTVRAA